MILRKQDFIEELLRTYYWFAAKYIERISLVSNLGFKEASFLLYLHVHNHPVQTKDILDYFSTTSTALANLTKRLIDKDLIDRTPSNVDSRVKYIRLTKTAEDYLTRLDKALNELNYSMLNQLTHNQQLELIEIIKIYTDYSGSTTDHLANSVPISTKFSYYFIRLFLTLERATLTRNDPPISFIEARLLNIIPLAIEHGMNDINGIAKILEISRTQVGDITSRLEFKGYVNIYTDPLDQRVRRVTYSQRMSSGLAILLEDQSRWFDQRMKRPNVVELIDIFIIFRKLNRYYHKHRLNLSSQK